MNKRPIDFYIKGLDFDTRQEIFKRLEACIAGKMRKLLEKPIGYPIFRSIGCTDEDIANQERKSTERFRAVNEIMIKNQRNPLFADPEDTYNSALEYVHLLEKQTNDDLVEEFGCLWNEYVPKVYIKKEDKK